MIARISLFAFLAVTLLAMPSPLPASQTTLTRRDIREMPIVQRPSRPGHFYGNTVRRGYNRRAG